MLLAVGMSSEHTKFSCNTMLCPASSVLTQWFCLEVDGNGTSNGVCNTQGRRGEVVGSCVGVDTPLKVPVAGQHTHSHQVLLFYCRDNLLWEWTTVSDTSHAAVTHQVEPVRDVCVCVCEGRGGRRGEGREGGN